MNLRSCEQCESSKGPGAGAFEPRGGQGLRKSCSFVPRVCGEQPAAHPGFGANPLRTLPAKFRPGIPSKRALGKRQGSLPSSLPAGYPAHVLLFLVWWTSPGASRLGTATSQPQGAPGPGGAVTAWDKGSKQWHSRSLPGSDRTRLYLITN